ncbi:MAG: hypothetical protein IPJ33_00720 [Gammaproteobacteria bacterium]|nr:hypothetical protein [Gammaproteobacteria bacterium]MBK7727052.1 hypothetical protein [Gammaproteobacteria bacterium]MBP6053587.1 hypothetical protein [Pseudomonadales bacterium]MBP6229322.1 hypothetical protein [Pseudomonadales bacterium]
MGAKAQRTESLIARSPTVRELIMQDTYPGALKELLSHAATVQLAVTAKTHSLYSGWRTNR